MSTAILNTNLSFEGISAETVHEVLRKKMLVDGFDLVFDHSRSYGNHLVDARTGEAYLDFFSFFASSPVGLNHPKLNNPEFREKIGYIASLNKPSNSDLYTVEMAEFVDTFSRVAVPEHFKYLFFIDGGSLAVENGLKVAFDWKVRKNLAKGIKEEKGQQVIHFKEAFHGRSGYTMSLTNTDPNKIMYFPKFKWPRIINPKITFPLSEHLDEVIKLETEAINEIYAAIKQNPDDIAVIIIEPIQAEGGDNFFRKEFHQKLREIADENEILLMYDEVQTGIGLTGKMWAHQHYIDPDIVSFGKKMQICGIMVSDRIDDVEEHCFRKSSRINSTWGGNLVDMVRSRRNLEIIEEDNLVENAELEGKLLLDKLYNLQEDYPELISNVRGLGLMCSFDFPTVELRKEFLNLCYFHKLLILPCGLHSIRFRPSLTITGAELNEGLKIIEKVLYLMKANL
ncbi:MAG: L-lysine 6-transaminase [Bacteroidota bacterium]|jgi:L-lysine 6-transaminase|nr:L-lysine 6-transaminase [Ignavibacteria bacterium]MCU7499249.1 L-lysine 6-transaminase [Ignavibacteria bacterium]MCU7512285.1 L-lysine 6-transaminase [Ignavibacteria bacterium]MCU7520312.1 L-lysine 6-transaminase [Ignavibacteria bacterium]MCU7523916.1 L-lysine 6-transaminase [Ignavibacteria bacterium]